MKPIAPDKQGKSGRTIWFWKFLWLFVTCNEGGYEYQRGSLVQFELRGRRYTVSFTRLGNPLWVLHK